MSGVKTISKAIVNYVKSIEFSKEKFDQSAYDEMAFNEMSGTLIGAFKTRVQRARPEIDVRRANPDTEKAGSVATCDIVMPRDVVYVLPTRNRKRSLLAE